MRGPLATHAHLLSNNRKVIDGRGEVTEALVRAIGWRDLALGVPGADAWEQLFHPRIHCHW